MNLFMPQAPFGRSSTGRASVPASRLGHGGSGSRVRSPSRRSPSRRVRFGQRGSALLVSLLLVFALSIGGAAGWRYLHVNLRETHRTELAAQAWHLAEAGLDKALASIRQNATYSGEYGTALGEGRFNVEVARVDSGVYQVVSRGELLRGDDVAAKCEVRARAAFAIDGHLIAYQQERAPAVLGDSL